MAAAVVLACVYGVQAQVVIETVTVGNPGNVADTRYETPGYGSVDYTYNIGKYEVTAGQYCEFLNAVAASDPYFLYSGNMDSSSGGCQITQLGTNGSYTYDFSGRPSGTEADWVNRPVNYVSWGDAARFANWLHNGQPTGAQDLTTTEDGSYYLNGAMSTIELIPVAREVDATWVIPSEDEWYKAAYHKNDGVTGNYWDFPTSTNGVPSNELIDPDPGNNANYRVYDIPPTDPPGDTIGPPYYRTEVGDFENSESPYGTFDQGGNVWEWNEAVIGSGRVLRGGSFHNSYYYLAVDHPSADLPSLGHLLVGFRVAEVSEQAPIPTVSEWGLIVLALLILGTGAVVLRSRRTASE